LITASTYTFTPAEWQVDTIEENAAAVPKRLLRL
jgi:hypothetical protein